MGTMTIALPARVDGRRQFFVVWGLWSVVAILFARRYALMQVQPLLLVPGVLIGITYGAMIGTIAEPVLSRLGVRHYRSSMSRKHRVGYYAIILGLGTLVNALVLGMIIKPASPVLVLLLLVVALGVLLSSLLVGLPISRRTGTIVLDPAGMSVGKQRWLFEQITAMETYESGELRINGAEVPALEGLNLEERTWLRGVLQERIAVRHRVLAEAGHDLSEPAPIPGELQAVLDRQP